MSDSKPRCLVVGAGIVGASCAWHLQRLGAAVTLIDPLPPGQATSYGNAGCISSSSVFPFSHPGVMRKLPAWLFRRDGPVRVRWSHMAAVAPWLYRFWRAGRPERVAQIVRAQAELMGSVTEDYDVLLSETRGGFLRESRGLILIYDSPEDFENEAWKYRMRDQLGIPWQRLSTAEARSMEPSLEADGRVAVLDPTAQHVTDPGRLVEWIAEAAVELGTERIEDRVVRVTAREAEVSVRTASGLRCQADCMVLATGAWSRSLIRQLGYDVPLIPKGGYHTMVGDPSVELSRPLHAATRHVVLTPMRAGLRISGTAEFARLDCAPDYRRASALVRHARRYVPELKVRSTSQWMGQRPMTPDSIPVIGPLPDCPRVVCAFGHGHYGLTQGPTTGRIVGRLVFGEDPGLELSPFSIGRFRGRRAA